MGDFEYSVTDASSAGVYDTVGSGAVHMMGGVAAFMGAWIAGKSSSLPVCHSTAHIVSVARQRQEMIHSLMKALGPFI